MKDSENSFTDGPFDPIDAEKHVKSTFLQYMLDSHASDDDSPETRRNRELIKNAFDEMFKADAIVAKLNRFLPKPFKLISPSDQLENAVKDILGKD